MNSILLWFIVACLFVQATLFHKKIQKDLNKFISASLLLLLIPVFLFSKELNMDIKFAIANSFIVVAFWSYSLYQYKLKKLLRR